MCVPYPRLRFSNPGGAAIGRQELSTSVELRVWRLPELELGAGAADPELAEAVRSIARMVRMVEEISWRSPFVLAIVFA